MSYQLHWNEGLFLQPHHFQQLQRSVFGYLEKIRAGAGPYGYGLTEIEVSEDELENNLLQFRRIAGVMPSGLAFAFPGNANLATIDLGANLAARGDMLTVLLGIPLWHESRANSASPDDKTGGSGKFHYLVTERSICDENSGVDEKPIAFRLLNARLLFDGDDRTDLEVIPLVRLVAAGGNRAGRYRLDQDFIGPCLHGQASARLYNLIQDTIHFLEGGRIDLRTHVARSGFAADTVYGRTLEGIMRLSAVTRAGTRLRSLLAAPRVTPYTWYLEMLALLADLSVFLPEQDLLADCPYQHDDPIPVFQEIQNRIKVAFKTTAPAASLRVEFKRTDNGYVAALGPEHLTGPTDYYLIVRSKQDARAVAQLVEDADIFKLMPSSLAQRKVFGLKLEKEEIPPPHLNVPRGALTFRVVRSANPDRWKDVEREKSITAFWPQHRTSDFELVLCMTLPA